MNALWAPLIADLVTWRLDVVIEVVGWVIIGTGLFLSWWVFIDTFEED